MCDTLISGAITEPLHSCPALQGRLGIAAGEANEVSEDEPPTLVNSTSKERDVVLLYPPGMVIFSRPEADVSDEKWRKPLCRTSIF
jgi:hypothetical protein